MTRTVVRGLAFAIAVLIVTFHVGEAHKPITSKYTYNEHVFTIVRDRCGRCHVDGGVAPMSLMTYTDAYPWAESTRAELLAAHMPPWTASTASTGVGRAGAADSRRSLTARELDVLMTWATGGTPEGSAAIKPDAVPLRNEWTLGPPDLVLSVPDETLPPGKLEETREFELPSQTLDGRPVRAVDVLPGTPAMVRRAIIYIRPATGAGPSAGPSPDPVLALWLPGGDTAPTPPRSGFALPPGSALVARVTFRKTWKYENTALHDQSRIGVYFGARDDAPIDAVLLGTGARVATSVDVLAVRVDVDRTDADLELRARLPDGTRVPIATVTTLPDWPGRYWLAQPLRLPAGSEVEAIMKGGSPAIAKGPRTGIALDVVAVGR